MTTSEARAVALKMEDAVKQVIHGQDRVVRHVLCCMISGGHVLLEDVPGTGKTTLAKAIAAATNGTVFKRVQFTPDLLPSDIVGLSVFDPQKAEFRFQAGPVFSDILLADEINRASPRVQSALLEAMAERQVTVDGVLRNLDGVFFVIATQNPVEFRGTYPLPEAQMDRFAMQCSLGYVNEEDETAILAAQQNGHPVEKLSSVIDRADLLHVMEAARQVRISADLQKYCVRLAAATRTHKAVQLAASPRASLALMKCSQALSLLEGREFVIPETIQDIAVEVLAHRLSLHADAKYSGTTASMVVKEIMHDTPVPL